VEIGSNVKIMDNSYITAETKVPDNCVFGGKPGIINITLARYLGEVTDGFDIMMSEFCSSYYKNLIITQSVISSLIY
jgi:hypothetical protein